jgi:PAS domain S-box-containing protein
MALVQPLLAPPDGDPEQFRLLLACVQDYAIFMLDPAGYVTTWNLGAQRIKGYEASEIIGRHFSIFYPPEQIAANKPAWELVVAEREGRFEDEDWRLRRDGTRFWANVVITAVRDAEGRLRGFGKVTRDLTARKAAEETAQRLAAERAAREVAEKANTYQRDLLAIVGHDLRNCLSVILTAAEMNRLHASEEKVRRRAAQVVRTTKRMREIIHGIIDYTYAQRDGIPIAVRDGADVHAACDRVLAEFRVLHPQRAFLYEAEGSPLGCWDEGRLEQVVQNLVGNALKYGSPTAPIAVRWSREGDDEDLVLCVHNEGAPIREDLLPAIFEPFRSGGEDVRGAGGSMGLGLFIVREIARAHGGAVSAVSTAEEGTTFTVRLPARSPATRRGSGTAAPGAA